MEIETEDQVEVEKVFKNPTIGLNPENYELGYKIAGEIEECACGKKIQTYYVIVQIYTTQKDEFGRMITDDYGHRQKSNKKFWEHKNYPENHCHCRCGRTWKEHLKD